MKKVLCRSLVLALGVTLVASAAFAKRTAGTNRVAGTDMTTGQTVNPYPTIPSSWRGNENRPNGMAPAGAALTTIPILSYNFDLGASCTAQGWTKTDGTLQLGTFWHVDAFTDPSLGAYAPLAGAQSLWCGSPPQGLGPICGYLTLPGYGNDWAQYFCSNACIAVSSDSLLDISMKLQFHSELGFDFFDIETTTDCTGALGWAALDDSTWSGVSVAGMGTSADYTLLAAPSTWTLAENIHTVENVRVRLAFRSDGGWSDEDNLWDSLNGPVIVDDISVEGIPAEDFEGEAPGATTATSWSSCNVGAFGQHMALFSGTGVNAILQEDLCANNVKCMWAAVENSTEDYSCGSPPHPEQAAIPYGNNIGQYLSNEVRSPVTAFVPPIDPGVELQFSAYFDMPIDNLTFYTWGVATKQASGCLGLYRDRNFVYYGDGKNWARVTFVASDLVNTATGTGISVRLGVRDMCGVWCGIYGSGQCHSHAPMLDNIRLYTLDVSGPVWNGQALSHFQDTFSTNGTSTGTGRADGAQNKIANNSPNLNIIPTDSAIAAVVEQNVGFAPSAGVPSRNAVYLYARCGSYTGAQMQEVSNAGAYGYIDDVVVGGGGPGAGTWHRFQGRQRTIGDGAHINFGGNFAYDLNDNLFVPGDVIEHFYGAENLSGDESYASPNTDGDPPMSIYYNIIDAADNASEFTILPKAGTSTGDILYVDGFDGRGGQQFWDTAFQQLGILDDVDRFDVRGPSSGVQNRLGGRVENTVNQLIGPGGSIYHKILWDCGNLSIGIGDGTGSPEKTNDYKILKEFLEGLPTPGGVYLCGDDVPQLLAGYTGQEAIDFRSLYLTYNLTSPEHRPTFGIAPQVVGFPARAFSGDTFVAFGGCPGINDFDVMEATGTALAQATYGPATTTNHAVISQVTTNGQGTSVRAMMSGFSFIYVRDDEQDGVLDRAKHLEQILLFLQNSVDEPTGATRTAVNRLEQNYPNPFNPQTTIAFSLKGRGRVKIDVYNVAGELVKTLVDETRDAGSYTDVRWDGTNGVGSPVASGVYFYKLVTNNFSQTKKMVLLK
jgi:hypothetical protein